MWAEDLLQESERAQKLQEQEQISNESCVSSSGDVSSVDQLLVLQEELLRTKKMLAASNQENKSWQCMGSQILSRILLSPGMNENYRDLIKEQLTEAMLAVPQVTCLSKLRCSLPSLKAEQLQLKLKSWISPKHNEWSLRWKPAWSIEMGVEGQYSFIPFTIAVRVEHFSLQGKLLTSFTNGLQKVSISFVQNPQVDMDISFDVKVGAMPLPLPEMVQKVVKRAVDGWLESNVVSPQRICISVFAEAKSISTEDVNRAKLAAFEARIIANKEDRGLLCVSQLV